MSHPHNVKELQEGIGQTGKFGEIFVVLGLLILVAGAILSAVGSFGGLHDPNSRDGGNGDAIQAGWLYFFEGLGFTMFGIMIMVSGWTRHHDE